jgi:hypothetical protein
MNGFWDLSVSWLQGVMVGIEFPPLMEIDEDVAFVMCVDLFIVRLLLIKWRTSNE